MTTAWLYCAPSLKEAKFDVTDADSSCYKRNIVSKVSHCFVEFRYSQRISQVMFLDDFVQGMIGRSLD